MANTAKILKDLRTKRELSQDEMAKFLSIDRTTYLKYEKTGNIPTIKIKKLAKFFSVTTDYLLGLSDLPCPTKQNNLTAEETNIIKLYRDLPAEAKTTIRTLVETQHQLYVKPKCDEKAI